MPTPGGKSLPLILMLLLSQVTTMAVPVQLQGSGGGETEQGLPPTVGYAKWSGKMGEAHLELDLHDATEVAGGHGHVIVPEPSFWACGNTSIRVSNSFKFIATLAEGEDMSLAFSRYHSLMFPPWKLKNAVDSQRSQSAECEIVGAKVSVKDANSPLGINTDESYSLYIPAMCPRDCATTKGTCSLHVSIAAPTQYGAMRALESLSQLLHFDYDGGEFILGDGPWTITDFPRFQHRELLLDTSRHFMPVPTMLRIIDSLPYAKINVLHWHAVDNQSFPLPTPRQPLLSQFGAFSQRERYSVSDVDFVVEYARQRAVRVIPEVDVPGHAASWCFGVPHICPSPSCTTPLSPLHPTGATPGAPNSTFQVISDVLDDLLGTERQTQVGGAGMFPDEFVHLGGDEVDTRCWNETKDIRHWLDANGMGQVDAYSDFVDHVQSMAIARGRQVVTWQEAAIFRGGSLPPEAVVQVWTGMGENVSIVEVTRAVIRRYGSRVIWSPDSPWYLDNGDAWKVAYDSEPCDALTEDECDHIIGGGGMQWGEKCDPSNAEATIWPRLAAIAERLWSPRSQQHPQAMSSSGDHRKGGGRGRGYSLAGDITINATRSRMGGFRCRLLERGVGASPLGGVRDTSDHRGGPTEPGGCSIQ